MEDQQNPFKQIESEKEVPEGLKEKVMRDVNYLRFFTDMAELFSVKYVETLTSLFKTEAGQEQAETNNKESGGNNFF
jgi:hypothetical protein